MLATVLLWVTVSTRDSRDPFQPKCFYHQKTDSVSDRGNRTALFPEQGQKHAQCVGTRGCSGERSCMLLVSRGYPLLDTRLLCL